MPTHWRIQRIRVFSRIRGEAIAGPRRYSSILSFSAAPSHLPISSCCFDSELATVCDRPPRKWPPRAGHGRLAVGGLTLGSQSASSGGVSVESPPRATTPRHCHRERKPVSKVCHVRVENFGRPGLPLDEERRNPFRSVRPRMPSQRDPRRGARLNEPPGAADRMCARGWNDALRA